MGVTALLALDERRERGAAAAARHRALLAELGAHLSDASTSFSSRFSRSTIAAGVFAGAKRPVHATMSIALQPGRLGEVGTSGSAAEALRHR